GAVMVHADGPDFTLLEPTWAALALTLAVPLTYALVMPPLVERWLREDSTLMSGTSRWPFVALVPWVFPLFFAGPPLLAGWWVRGVVTASPSPAARAVRRAAPWAGRLALTGVLALALTDLVTEIAEIYRLVERRYAP
ncbi:MAG: hypothetical protein ABWX71_06545, partial [Aeromicrobium sp.]